MGIKRPKAGGGRRLKPRDSQSTSFNKERPIFSLHHLQNSHCLSLCDRDQKAAFADALYKRSRLSWGELKQVGRHGLGYEKIYHTSMSVPIPSCVTEDVTIIAFRFNGHAPMIGYRDQATFHVVWIDPNYTAYDH